MAIVLRTPDVDLEKKSLRNVTLIRRRGERFFQRPRSSVRQRPDEIGGRRSGECP